MPTPPITERVLAHFASDAVHCGVLDPASVVAWADGMIAAGGVPPPWMIDLSLVNPADLHALLLALRAVPGTSDLNLSLSLLNGLVLREWRGGRLTIGRVRGIGWRLYTAEPERRDLSQWGVVLECMGEEFDDGYRPQSDLAEVIEQELSPFAAYIPLLPPWV